MIPRFHCVYYFDSGLSDFLLAGVYSKAEDAAELKEKLDKDNWPATVIEESLAALTHRLYPLNELIEATKEVLRISDRNHDAWTRCYAAIKALEKP